MRNIVIGIVVIFVLFLSFLKIKAYVSKDVGPSIESHESFAAGAVIGTLEHLAYAKGTYNEVEIDTLYFYNNKVVPHERFGSERTFSGDGYVKYTYVDSLNNYISEGRNFVYSTKWAENWGDWSISDRITIYFQSIQEADTLAVP